MKIYLLKQDINYDYDTFDSAVVVANNEDDARTIHPNEYGVKFKRWWAEQGSWGDDDVWVAYSEIDKIKVTYLGEAEKSLKRGVIISSFNAG